MRNLSRKHPVSPRMQRGRSWTLALCIATLLLLSACGKQPGLPSYPQQVEDIVAYDQDPREYIRTGKDWPEGEPFPAAIQEKAYQEFRSLWLRPWRANFTPVPANDALWGVKTYAGKTSWDSTGLQRPATWTNAVAANAAQGGYPSLRRPGIVLANANLRVLPTAEPFFLDPTKPGEGYPFDYFQNSAVWAATPVMITHESADGAWWHVEGPFASGWLPKQVVGMVDAAFMDAMRNAPWAAVVTEKVPLRPLVVEGEGQQLGEGGIGMVLPIVGEGERGMHGHSLGLPVQQGRGIIWSPVLLATHQAVTMPVPMTQESIASVAARMQGQTYGWGGIDGKRDCSSMLRDLFTPFGIFLPRNSSQQARAGDRRTLEGLSIQQKEALLLAEGLPFRTLVHLPGHIMLYIGEEDGRPLLFHAIWGVRSKLPDGSEGRVVLGSTVVTSLTPGAELPDVKRHTPSLADRVTSFILLPSSTP